MDVYYTITPPTFETALERVESKRQLICYRGTILYVTPYDAQHYQILDLCTTNPAVYLKKEFQPGHLISFGIS